MHVAVCNYDDVSNESEEVLDALDKLALAYSNRCVSEVHDALDKLALVYSNNLLRKCWHCATGAVRRACWQ